MTGAPPGRPLRGRPGTQADPSWCPHGFRSAASCPTCSPRPPVIPADVRKRRRDLDRWKRTNAYKDDLEQMRRGMARLRNGGNDER